MNRELPSDAIDFGEGPRWPPIDSFRDIADEIEDHLACSAERHEATGLRPEDARAAAVSDFGDPKRIAVELALIAQGDTRMRQKILYALIGGLTVALVATAFFGYRSTVMMREQMDLVRMQLRAVAEAPERAAAEPAPYGRILIHVDSAGEPVADFKVRVMKHEDDKAVLFDKTYRTDEKGQIDTGPLTVFGIYEATIAWPHFYDGLPDWGGWMKRRVRVNQPGECVDLRFELASADKFEFVVGPPANCTLAHESVRDAEVRFGPSLGKATFHYSGRAVLGQPILLPVLPTGAYPLRIEYGNETNTNGKPEWSSLGSAGQTVEFPLTEARLTVQPEMSKPILSGRVFDSNSDSGISSARITLAALGDEIVALSDPTGYFGIPVPNGGRSSRGGAVFYVQLPRPNGEDYELMGLLSTNSELEIDVSKLAFLTIRGEDNLLVVEPTPEIHIEGLSVVFKMKRPSDSPDWSREIYTGQLTRRASLEIHDAGIVQPTQLVLPTDSISNQTFLEVDIGIETDGVQYQVALEGPLDIPTLRPGVESDMVITPRQLVRVLRDGKPPLGSFNPGDRLDAWRATLPTVDPGDPGNE